MRCDDPGGVCAADQPRRAGSEQMREKEGDTRQKRGGVDGGRARQSAEQCPLPLHRLHDGSSKQDRITASPVETAGMVQSNIQHCAQRILLCEQGTGDICAADEAAHRERVGYALVLSHKGGPPLVAEPKRLLPAPRPRLLSLYLCIGGILTFKMLRIK